ncbi:hypothetical protein GCM10008967_35040 [Bacillus carboniphilus]|uniref:NAD-dependent epimerase/dehydratase domain-containing protein n=1 Tax=Bacillus carboniphilus TaxID=86663 RepID=A0ABN0WM34_9BACI
MKVAIAGGTGFVGHELSQWFQKRNIHLLVLTRNPSQKPSLSNVQYVQWMSEDASPEKELEGPEPYYL